MKISYYYSKEEYCLYIKLGSIVFSFHHVPLTTDVLKASFAPLIKWPGIRLQRIAQPLLNYALSMNNEIETTPMDINDIIIDEVVDSSSVNGFNSEKSSITKIMLQKIMVLFRLVLNGRTFLQQSKKTQ